LARLWINGQEAEVSGGGFEGQVSLDLGPNQINVEARQDGFEPARETVTITREEPAPEPEPLPEAEPEPVPQPSETVWCDPDYEGACLDPNSPDYDCEGAAGTAPTTPVR
jgi:hypothetical protein